MVVEVHHAQQPPSAHSSQQQVSPQRTAARGGSQRLSSAKVSAQQRKGQRSAAQGSAAPSSATYGQRDWVLSQSLEGRVQPSQWRLTSDSRNEDPWLRYHESFSEPGACRRKSLLLCACQHLYVYMSVYVYVRGMSATVNPIQFLLQIS